MPMDQQPGLLALDVIGQGRKFGMDAIGLVMNAQRGIVRDEHIHAGKARRLSTSNVPNGMFGILTAHWSCASASLLAVQP